MGSTFSFFLSMTHIGLIFVPNGRDFGMAMGDSSFIEQVDQSANNNNNNMTSHLDATIFSNQATSEKYQNDNDVHMNNNINVTTTKDIEKYTVTDSHPWGIFFTILGTALLDFNADACQSPSRAYLLDITLPEDHAIGLSTFTIMAGLGGSLGYTMGAINWDVTSFGKKLGGQVHAVFTIIAFIYLICVSITIFSFREIPLHLLEKQNFHLNGKNISQIVGSKKLQRRTANRPISLLPSYHYKKFVDDVEDESTAVNQKVETNKKQSDDHSDYDDNNEDGDINEKPFLQNSSEEREKYNEKYRSYLKSYGSLNNANDYPVSFQNTCSSKQDQSACCTDTKQIRAPRADDLENKTQASRHNLYYWSQFPIYVVTSTVTAKTALTSPEFNHFFTNVNFCEHFQQVHLNFFHTR